MCREAQLPIIKQVSAQVSRGSSGQNQADERVGVERFSWRLSIRRVGKCREAQLAIIKQVSGQMSRGSSGQNQADERAGVARFSWQLSSR